MNGLISELCKLNVIDAGHQQSVQFDDLVKEEEEKHHFKPQNGNVAFASGYDCWSFTLPSFVPRVAEKLGMKPKKLQ